MYDALYEMMASIAWRDSSSAMVIEVAPLQCAPLANDPSSSA